MAQQTLANKYLIWRLISELKKMESEGNQPPHIINIGSGKEVFIEDNLTDAGCNYYADRIDIDDCTVTHPYVKNSWKCSVESMSPVNSHQYDIAFANWVLEHVPNLTKASQEIYRILKPSGKFIATLPNPAAPEFILAKLTPLWFHKIIRDVQVWETYYAYKNIKQLTEIFEHAGLRKIEIRYLPSVKHYLAPFPLLDLLGKFYDEIISSLGIKLLMGHVCVVFEKNPSL